MKEHKHAEVLRALADGVPIDEFEIEYLGQGFGKLKYYLLCDAIMDPDNWEIRRKPQYIIVNGFKVPKPLDVMPKHGTDYFIPNPCEDDMFSDCGWRFDDEDTMYFRRNIVHPTKEAAIAHAKAMLGIDPKWEPYFP